MKKVVIIGAGSAGLSVAARMVKAAKDVEVTIVDPSAVHYYQPLFTLVGGGVVEKSQTMRATESLIPKNVEWVRQAVAEVEPHLNQLTLGSGEKLGYDYLVVCPGIQVDWQKIKGLEGNLGQNSICSNYSAEHVEDTWREIKNFKGGTAIFTFPNTPVKCAGAPQKIMYLAEHYWRKKGLRKDSKVMFASAAGAIFGVKKYAATLSKIVAKRGIETKFKHNLVSVDAAAKTATFVNADTGTNEVIAFDFIHVTPPMSAPDFIKRSALANKDGWVDVDKHTLQHPIFKNVFALGDASSLPTSKTGAAIRKQAPIVVKHVLATMSNTQLTEKYDGYTSCPLVTGYGRLVLAEFDYDGNPCETFPFDQGKERWSMYMLKKHFLPKMYWHGMLKGRI